MLRGSSVNLASISAFAMIHAFVAADESPIEILPGSRERDHGCGELDRDFARLAGIAGNPLLLSLCAPQGVC